MAVQAMTRTRAARNTLSAPLQRTIGIGLIFAVIGIYLAIVGLLTMLHARWIIVDVLSLGHALVVAIAIGAGGVIARRSPEREIGPILGQALIAGAITGAGLALLILAMDAIDLRAIFISLSPALTQMLTLDLGIGPAMAILIGGGALLAALGALLCMSPPVLWRPLLYGFCAVAFFGVFQELLQIMMQWSDWIDTIRDTLYTWEGLTLQGAILIFVVVAGCTAFSMMLHRRGLSASSRMNEEQLGHYKMVKIGLVALLLILFPLAAGSYIGQVLMLVGLYTLMGMGLNLEVGLAGLLDLGFVAFFAVGAYVTALLTADSPHAIAAMNYWQAMPIAVMCSVLMGIMFGIPVLGVRGDYLAVATMGLGEIVRVIVQSDMAAPLLAGAQGILQIPKPVLFGYELADPVDLFYLTLVASAIAAFCAWRLENSRLGRAWMAVRDDEDVAQALGINLVKVKLLAYGLGAAFAGLAGSIFAVMLTSIYPSSFQLLISINVLALIIVGGMGSLPGVLVGSAVLVGLPELLREFGEYRYLFYGVALIIMMRIKPEGLWPSATRQRELHADDEPEPETVEAEDGTGMLAAVPAGDSRKSAS